MKNFNNKTCSTKLSSDFKLKATFYKLELDGFIIKYGSVADFNTENISFEEHVFMMQTSDNEVTWEIDQNDKSKKRIISTGKNDIMFIPANFPLTQKTENYYEFISIVISNKKLLSFAKIFEDKKNEFERLYNIIDPHLEYIFKLLLSEVKLDNKNGSLFIDNLMSLLAIHFIENYSISENNLVENFDGLSKEDFEKILVYINHNLSSSIKLEDLGEEIGTNKYNLIKRFKTSTSFTPHQFITQKKLEHSKKLLRNIKYSITDVTYLLNFTDQSHFTKSFKKAYGLTPNEFRKAV